MAIRDSAWNRYGEPGLAALGVAGAADVCRFQSSSDADGVCLGRALAGATPHSRDHGHSACLAYGQPPVDRSRAPAFRRPFAFGASAVFEKEVRYLARSGPMLLPLVMPIFVLVIFRLGPLSSARGFSRAPGMAFPGAAGYALLMLTNLVYNNFGGDAGGIQFFYASPVRFSQIVLAQNLTHASILMFDTALPCL